MFTENRQNLFDITVQIQVSEKPAGFFKFVSICFASIPWTANGNGVERVTHIDKFYRPFQKSHIIQQELEAYLFFGHKTDEPNMYICNSAHKV